MLGLQTDFRPPRASIQTPAAFLPENEAPDEKRSEIYRGALVRARAPPARSIAPGLSAGLARASQLSRPRSVYALVRDGTESIIYLPPYLPHAVYCPIDFADRRTLYHRPARESSHLLLYMLLLTSGWEEGGGGEGIRETSWKILMARVRYGRRPSPSRLHASYEPFRGSRSSVMKNDLVESRCVPAWNPLSTATCSSVVWQRPRPHIFIIFIYLQIFH